MGQTALHDKTAEPRLTAEEVQMLAHVARGRTGNVTARSLGMSDRTLRRRVRLVCDRLGVGTSIEAVVWAAKQGLV